MERKTRLLHLLTTLDPGGAEIQTLRVASRLPKERFEVAVSWLKGPGGMAPRYEAAGIRPLSFAEAARFRPDLVHTHMMKADAAGALLAKCVGARLVSTKHNEDVYLRSPLYAAAARAVAGMADRLIAVSAAVERFFVEALRLPAGRLTRIYHGLPPADPLPPDTRSVVRRELDLPPRAAVVLTVARLSAQKGLGDLVEAAWPGACWLVAGRGEDEATLRASAAERGLGEAMRFLGFRDDVPRLLAAADLFVLPSRWEGFGLSVLEAMRAGLPVVAAAAGALPEVVLAGRTGLLVPPADPAALAGAIRSLLANPARAEAMGRAGRDRAARVFPLSREVAEHVRLYDEVLG
jgi:glycosyltransferase involved in cell wall biosynthesis